MSTNDFDSTRAIILTTQRTGSTFLVECLDSHPQVGCVSELLSGGVLEVPEFMKRYRVLTKGVRYVVSGAWCPTRMMDRFYADGTEPVKVFKAMYNHIANPFTLKYILRNTDIKILHLRRENLLKMYVSKLLTAKERVKKWQPHTTEPIPAIQTRVDPREALAYMQRAKALYCHYDKLFSDHDRMPLIYERMIEGQSLRQETAWEICDFLGIERRAMHSRLIKMNPESLQDMVTNYDELVSMVSGSEFAELL